MIGADMAAKSPADGYTWLAMTLTHAANVTLFPQAQYNLLKDFAAVSVLGAMPLVVVVHPDSPVKSLSELTALGRSRPLLAGSSGNGTPPHLGLELYRVLTKVGLQHVPYKGGAPSLVDLVGGRTDFIVSNLPECIGYLKGGKLRPLAITSSSRHVLIPDVPTVAEALGIAQFDSQTWFALAGPAGMPRAVVERLQRAVAQIIGEPDMRDRLQLMGLAPAEDTTPESLATLMRTYAQRNAALMDAAKMTPE